MGGWTRVSNIDPLCCKKNFFSSTTRITVKQSCVCTNCQPCMLTDLHRGIGVLTSSYILYCCMQLVHQVSDKSSKRYQIKLSMAEKLEREMFMTKSYSTICSDLTSQTKFGPSFDQEWWFHFILFHFVPIETCCAPTCRLHCTLSQSSGTRCAVQEKSSTKTCSLSLSLSRNFAEGCRSPKPLNHSVHTPHCMTFIVDFFRAVLDWLHSSHGCPFYRHSGWKYMYTCVHVA